MTVHTVPRATKERIRQARDQAVRAKRAAAILAGQITTCTECGCDHDTHTKGCGRCDDRRGKARKRTQKASRDTAATING